MSKAVIGIDLGGTNIKAVLLDIRGYQILDSLSLPTPKEGGAGRVVDEIGRAVEELTKKAGTKGYQVTAAGIGAAGLVHEGVVRNSPNLPGWQGAVPLKKMLGRRLAKYDLAITIENDVNAFIIAEQKLGAARGTADVIGLTLGTGVGGGIIINGRLYHGAGGGAGEIGHMVIKHDGPRCKCGNQGCLEALVGSQAIINRYNDLRFRSHQKIEKYIEVKELAQRARKGDSSAKKAFADTGTILGVGLSNLINIFNPQAIIIGGGVAQAGDLIIKPALREVKNRAMPYNRKNVKILKAKLGPLSGAIGSAIVAINH